MAARPRAGPAFTLIELLVVLGVLTLLASLFLAVLSPHMKAGTRRAACVKNLHQLGVELNSYVANLHQYPTANEWGSAALSGSGGRLLPYIGQNYGVFICPEKQRTVNLDSPTVDFQLFSYGYNGAGTARAGRDLELGMGLIHRICESRIKVPSDMIVAGDSGVGDLSYHLLSPNEIAGMKESLIPVNPQLPSTRHSGGANVLFCDGRVAYGPQKKWVEKTPQSRRQWNNDNQPHRETW